MKQNIGMVNRYARLVTGILALNYASSLGKKRDLGRGLMVSFGALKIAEGLMGWCPAVEVCNRIFQQDSSNSTNPKSLVKQKSLSQSNNPDSSSKQPEMQNNNHKIDEINDESVKHKSEKNESEEENHEVHAQEAF